MSKQPYSTQANRDEHDEALVGTKRVLNYGWDATNLRKVRIASDANGNILPGMVNANTHTGKEELRVYLEGHVCLQNTTQTPLLANAVFTGEWQDTLDYSEVIISVKSDKASATRGLVIQWSSLGTNVDEIDDFSVSANTGKTYSFPCNRRYVRLKYTNGAVNQGTFDLATYLKRFASKGSSHRMGDDLVADDDAIATKTLITAERAGSPGVYQNVTADVSGNLMTTIGGITQDAGGRVRVSQLTTLGDYKMLGYDRSLLMENAGDGTGAYANNKYNMSVTAGQWYVRQSKRFHPYFSGKSQMFELTFDGFGLQANVIKRVGGFSSNAVSPFASTYDGVWLENTGTTYVMKAARAGTETVSVDWTAWDNYNLVKDHNWDNFTVILIDYLWLGGAVYRLWLKNGGGFTLLHTVHYAGTAADVFILSPNQPVRYEIRSTTGTGSFRYICAQCSTEGSINESGMGRTVRTANITVATPGTSYPLIGIRKATAYRDIAIIMEDIFLFPTSANDQVRWSLQLNPTLSAGLTYSALANSAVEWAVGNGTITVTGEGTILAAGAASTNAQIPSNILKLNFLSYLGSTLNNTMDQIVLCVIPITSNVVTYSSLAFKEI